MHIGMTLYIYIYTVKGIITKIRKERKDFIAFEILMNIQNTIEEYIFLRRFASRKPLQRLWGIWNRILSAGKTVCWKA